jgi:hypothetical protein
MEDPECSNLSVTDHLEGLGVDEEKPLDPPIKKTRIEDIFEEAEEDSQPFSHVHTVQEFARVASRELGEKKMHLLEAAAQIGGLELVRSLLDQALVIESQGGMMTTDGLRRRTSGGVFFTLLKEHLSSEEVDKVYESEREAAKERKRRKRRIQAQRRDRKKDFVPLQRATGGEQEEGQEEGGQQEQEQEQQQGASYAFVVNMHSTRLVTPEKAEQAIGQEEKEEPVSASSPKPDRKVKRSRSQMESSEPTQPKLMQSLSWGGDEDSSDEEVDLEEARRQARQWSEGVQA